MSEERNSNGVNVYLKVYEMLLKQDNDKLRPYEFYYMIEQMKLNYDEIMGTIENALLKAGFSKEHIVRISNNLSWKLRFTRKDARAIERELCKRGLITRDRNFITVIDGGNNEM